MRALIRHHLSTLLSPANILLRAAKSLTLVTVTIGTLPQVINFSLLNKSLAKESRY
jgi:hypothetical protein